MVTFPYPRKRSDMCGFAEHFQGLSPLWIIPLISLSMLYLWGPFDQIWWDCAQKTLGVGKAPVKYFAWRQRHQLPPLPLPWRNLRTICEMQKPFKIVEVCGEKSQRILYSIQSWLKKQVFSVWNCENKTYDALKISDFLFFKIFIIENFIVFGMRCHCLINGRLQKMKKFSMNQ